MPPKTRPVKSQKSAGNIMDDAPLFAGLDDFVLKQTSEKEAGISLAVDRNEKKAPGSRKTKSATAEPLTQRAPHPVPKATGKASTETRTILLSVIEMCDLLKISRATLNRMDKSGLIPGRIKLGGSVRFHRETVETWLQSMITTRSSSE